MQIHSSIILIMFLVITASCFNRSGEFLSLATAS